MLGLCPLSGAPISGWYVPPVVVPIPPELPPFGSGGGTGGGSWPRPWKPTQPIEDDEALYLTGLI